MPPLPPAHLPPAGTFSMLFRTSPSTILPNFKTTRFFFSICHFWAFVAWTIGSTESLYFHPLPLFYNCASFPIDYYHGGGFLREIANNFLLNLVISVSLSLNACLWRRRNHNASLLRDPRYVRVLTHPDISPLEICLWTFFKSLILHCYAYVSRRIAFVFLLMAYLPEKWRESWKQFQGK